MTGLDQLLTEGLACRLGWMLLHSLWQGAVVAGAFALALSVIPQRRANARYLAGCLSLLAIVLLCGVTFVMIEPRDSIAQSPPTRVERVASLPSAVTASPVALTPTDVSTDTAVSHSSQPSPAGQAPMAITSPSAATAEEPWRDRVAAIGRATLAPCLPWLAWLWLAGVSALSIWRLGGLIATYRLRTIATAPVSEEILALVAGLANRLQVSRPIRVLQTVVLHTPAVIGHLRPVLLLPLSALTGLSPGAIEAIIAHELAHIRRHDYLINLLQTVVETLLFHHPAVWWISRQIRVEREHCCDDLALAVCGDRLGYARALAGLGRLGDAGLGLAAAATGGSLLQRIRRIAGLPARDANPSSRWLAGAVTMTVVIASAILVHAATGTSGTRDSSKASALATQPATANPGGAPSQSGTVRLANGVNIEVLGLTKTVDGARKWWAPDGQVIENPGVPATSVKDPGTVLAFRVTPQDATFKGYALKCSEMLEFRHTRRIEGTGLWVATLDFPEDRQFANLLFYSTGGTWKTLYTLPLTAGDAGHEKKIENYKIHKITELGKVNTETIRCTIRHEPRLPGTRFAAVDKAGNIHAPAETIPPEQALSRLTFALPLDQLAGIVRQQLDTEAAEIRNVSLRPGVKARVEPYVYDRERAQREVEANEAAPARTRPVSPFVFKPPGGGTAELLAVTQYSAGEDRWWAPDGSPASNPGVLPADIEGSGAIVAMRMTGACASGWMTFHLKDAKREQVYGSHVPGGFWLIHLDNAPSDLTGGFILDLQRGSYDFSSKIPLTMADLGKDRDVHQAGVARITGFRRTQPRAFELTLVYEPGSQPAEFAAVDKAGHLHKYCGSYTSDGQTLTCPFPVEELTGIVRQQPDRTEVDIRGIALRPGQKSDVRFEIKTGPQQTTTQKPTIPLAPVLADTDADTPRPASRPAARTAKPRQFDLRVIHRDTKQPLAGVAVKFRIDKAKPKAVTDQDGRCHIELPAQEPEDFTITCSKEGMVNMFAFWYRYHYKLGIPAEFTIAMEPAVSIGGIVQDEQGKPISGVKVSVSLPGTSVTAGHTVYPQVRDVEVRTDDQGRWHFDAMPEKFEALSILLMHPDYLSDTQYGDRKTPPIEELRARTAVQVMKKGLTITGIVRDDNGKPISGATVSRNPNMRVMSWYKDEKTDAEGRFRFIGVPAGQMVLTVKASGYGPSLTQIQVGPGTPPIEVRMQPGKTLRGRIVDPQGKPISGAGAFAKTWRGYDVIVEWLKTDTEGRFSLPDAPSDTIHFEFSKGGYLYHEQDLAAGDQELVITLRPSIRVTGKVVDATTNEPIRKFTVVPGFTWDATRKEVFWDRMHAHAMVNGKFEYTFDDSRHTYAIQIEAQGYKPAISEQFAGDKNALIINFKLERSAGLTGIVRLPDGKPAAGAEVIVGTKASSVYLQNGRTLYRTDHLQVQTGTDGRFTLAEPQEEFALIILHDRGYAEIKKDKLTQPLEIALQPWGRLEGVLMIGNKPGGNEEVEVHFPRNVVLPGAFWAYRTNTDASGKFSFDRLLPDRGQVARSITGPEMPGGMFSTFPASSTPIDVKAGQTFRVKMGGTGRPIVGRARLPEGIDRKVNWIWGSCHLNAAHERSTPSAMVYSTAGLLKSDGSFRLEDVPAGDYELMIRLEEPNPGDKNGMMKEVGMIRREVTVPEMAGGRSDEALDLGDIAIEVR